MHYLLFYEVGEDYVLRRARFREAHLEKAWKASEGGELVLGGALANPVDGAVLLFSGRSPDVAEKFARDDPYVTSGLVKRWYVREWSTVAGVDAASPLRPQAAEATVEQGLGSTAKSMSMPPESSMILRMWKARSTVEKAGEYVQHATKQIFPKLRAIEGHRGAYLLRRMLDGAIELVVLTLWDSMTAVRRFAGPEPEKAVVEPEAKAILASFDEHVTHFEVVEH
ncbi:MAG TPA: YciI-like protein [Terriglobales bacterium]|nr:YciI-like protein [Terriglobales bacterium]